MTNIDKAAALLHQRSKGLLGVDSDAARRACQEHAQALHEAGLLTPDLPEPHREVALHTPEWFLDGPISLVVSDPSEGVVSYGSDVHNGAFRLVLTKEEAEGIALALLAATNHTQEEACPR